MMRQVYIRRWVCEECGNAIERITPEEQGTKGKVLLVDSSQVFCDEHPFPVAMREERE